MELRGKAKRVRVYLKESDVIGRKLAPMAVLDFLRAERASGATVFRGFAGLGASGRINENSLPELAPHLPVIVEWVDTPDRVQRLLPRLRDIVQRGLITVEDTEIALYRPHGVRDLPDTVTAREVMSRDVRAVGPDAPLRTVVELVEGKIYRAVPVVEGGRPVGIITNQDLVERGGLLARVELLAALPGPERASALERLDKERKTAREVMTRDPVTVREDVPLTEVGKAMAERRLKRLPVVDGQGRMVGVVSRLDLLRTVAERFAPGAEEPPPSGLRGDLPLSRIMRKDVPVVSPHSSLGEVLEAIVSTPMHRALVVDDQRRVLGVVGDEELLDRVTPALRPSALRSLMSKLPFSARQGPAAQHASASSAAELMRDALVAREDQLLRDAIAPMMKAPHRIVGVVDKDGRLVGAVDREDILRGLVST
jgi:CBS domain-containing protein